MSPTVLIGGYYGHGNAGDEAILAAVLADLRVALPGVEAVVSSGDPARTTAGHGVQAVASNDIVALADAVRASDLVILGGGGLFQDYWESDPEAFLTPRHGGLLAYLTLPVLAALHGRPAMIWGVGVGPLRTGAGREQARAAFALCQGATVRDPESLALLAELGLPGPDGPPIELAADPAFRLPPLPASRIDELLAGLGAAAGEPLLGVSLRPWSYDADPLVWEPAVAGALDRYPGKLLLLPFEGTGEHEDDLSVLRRVRAALADPGRALLVEQSLEPAELAGLLGRCDAVLAMRFHAVLFALAAGVPAVGLAYDPKVTALLDRADLGELALPASGWQTERIEEALRRAVRVRDGLPGFAAAMQALARKSSAVAKAVLESRPQVRPEARRFLDQVTLGKILDVIRLQEQLATERTEQAAQAGQLRSRVEAAWADLAQAGTDIEQGRAALVTARGEADELRGARERLREQRDILLRERNELARRLGEVEGTLAYRIVSRFWALMRRLFPEGSGRRRFYRGVRGTLAGWLGTAPPPPDLVPAYPVEPGGEGPDPRGDLLRFEEKARERGADMVVAILSATHLLESEGQRPTQIALELSRRGIPVVFCYWRWWPHEWCPQDRLEEGIVQVPLDLVVEKPELLIGSFAGLRTRIVLFEFPYPGFFELLAAANGEGWITVYDVLDDWDEFHRVGQAIWYDEPFERHLIHAADATFAINEFLTHRIRDLGGDRVGVVGNGLKPGLDVIREELPLVRGEVTVGYFGYLAGAWFDWELIAEAARRRPAWRFYLIGYGGSPEGVVVPGNVELLGKKPQGELAAWAANWDVAIIPFKPDRLAAGADPIKTYEYLAMGLPVVATGVYPPVGGEAFVSRAEGVDEFLSQLAAAAALPDGDAAARRAYAATCTWGARLDGLLAALERGEQGVALKRALAGERP